MSDYRIPSSGRILPGGVETEIHRLPMRLIGGALIVMAGIGWISLASWSIGDPSLNSATGGAPRNLLGVTGASLADMLFQMVGLASITLFLPPAAWGFTLFVGDLVSAPRHRLAMWTLSVLLIASTLSLVPKPQGWPLVHGLGGMVGDFGKSLLLSLGGVLNERLAAAIGSAGAGFLGLWALLRASGIGRYELGLLWKSSSLSGSGLSGLLGHAY
ncbi:MAG: hypothetical protein HC850_10105, partial [Rhodomicrobium sp.]|nr:hypothetical protein [Rhodomicrobium sp.]